MNKLAGKIANLLGSTWVIGGFGLWVIVHGIISSDYVSFISDLAIEIGFLILRAESSQNAKMENLIKQDVKNTKQVLEEVKEPRALQVEEL